MGDFFIHFIEGLPLHLTAGDCAIKLSVVKICLRDQISFKLGLLISHVLHFHVFDAEIISKQPGLPIHS